MSKQPLSYFSPAGVARLVGILSVAALVYLYALAPALQTAWAVSMKLRGHADECSWARVVRFYPDLMDFDKTYRDMQKEIRVVEEDPSLDLVRIEFSGRDLWIRKEGDGRGIAYLLAEHDWMSRLSSDHAVRKGEIVIDVGAHVGIFTRKALDRGAAKVIAIEPDPLNVECLRRNFSDEIADGRVVIVPEGAWDKEDSITLYLGESSGWNSVMGPQGAGAIDIRVRPIDDMVAELKLDRVDLIKMDIEGAEIQALEGARATLLRDRPRIMIDTYQFAGQLPVLKNAVLAAHADYQSFDGPCEPTQTFDEILPHMTFYE